LGKHTTNLRQQTAEDVRYSSEAGARILYRSAPFSMQDIEPFYGWEKYYSAADDERSPFHEREYNMQQYEHDIYGYYIHPLWDEIGSETLYCKLLFTNYDRQFVVIELFGEWNDTLHNDVMYLKRQVIDPLIAEDIKYFILIGENLLNFHGSDAATTKNGLTRSKTAGLRPSAFPILSNVNGRNITSTITSITAVHWMKSTTGGHSSRLACLIWSIA
jgi:hypothetical protein